MYRLLTTLLSLVIFTAFSTSYAADAGLTLNRPLPSLPDNQEMRVLTIDVAPGQTSSPHRHNAHVFVYILSGSMNMQVEGGPLVQLFPGDMFYESPENIHAVSDNASLTEPAKFLVHIIKTIDAPVSVPVN